jgi:allantoinase
MGFAVDPYITGMPHGIGALEAVLDDLCCRSDVRFMQGREILDWYEKASHG